MRVEIDDRRIHLYLNGSLMVTAYDERLTRGGIGFMASRGARVQIDDVVVTGPAQAQTSFSQQNLVADMPFLYIDPVSGPRGTNHIITVMSLQPDEEIEFNIFFEGQSVLTGSHTADATGVAFFEVFSERNDPPGEYIVEAWHNGEIIATGVLIVEE